MYHYTEDEGPSEMECKEGMDSEFTLGLSL